MGLHQDEATRVVHEVQELAITLASHRLSMHYLPPLMLSEQFIYDSFGQRGLYRGEPECYDRVSSGIYRSAHGTLALRNELLVDGIEYGRFQDRQMEYAKQFVPSTISHLELMSRIQHAGGKTSLIDFTSDINIALFFACWKSPETDGRVIFLETRSVAESEDYKIYKITEPAHMADAQKSYAVTADQEYISAEHLQIYEIDRELKPAIMEYLNAAHDVNIQTVFNDLSGFVRIQDFLQDAQVELSNGVKAVQEERLEDSLKHFDRAATYDTVASVCGIAYYIRSLVHIELGNMELAGEDLVAFSRYGWDSKPELSPVQQQLLDETLEKAASASGNNTDIHAHDTRAESTKSPPLPRTHITATDPQGRNISGVVVRIRCRNGYHYKQIATDHQPLVITVPAVFHGIELYMSFDKDGYRGVHNISFTCTDGDSIHAKLVPIESCKDMPDLDISAQWVYQYHDSDDES